MIKNISIKYPSQEDKKYLKSLKYLSFTNDAELPVFKNYTYLCDYLMKNDPVYFFDNKYIFEIENEDKFLQIKDLYFTLKVII
jgi:hypothetical protein